MMPTLSIVTPSFRQAQYLEATLQSVLRQGDQVHEYFVIDGGSDDGSVDILRRYETQLTGWVSEKDAGQGDALNKGFARCSGDILGWVNSDDVYLPGTLEAVRQAFAADPAVDFVAGWAIWMDEEARIMQCKRRCVGSLAQARAGMLAAQPCCFFRRSLLEKAGPIDTGLWLSLDTDLFLRMFRVARKVARLPRYTAACRLQPQAKTQLHAQGKVQALYGREKQILDERHPEFRAPSAWSALRRFGWRLQFSLSGERAREKKDTQAWRGQLLDEVFPWG